MEQALAELRATEGKTPIGNYRVVEVEGNPRLWQVRDGSLLVTLTNDSGLHQLAGAVLAAESRRQGV